MNRTQKTNQEMFVRVDNLVDDLQISKPLGVQTDERNE